jgi:hypothetical protein
MRSFEQFCQPYPNTSQSRALHALFALEFAEAVIYRVVFVTDHESGLQIS